MASLLIQDKPFVRAPTTLAPNVTPCLGLGYDVETIEVMPGDVINMTFPGQPPFHIPASGSAESPERNGGQRTTYCGFPGEVNITTNSFTWDVQSYSQPTSDDNNITLGIVGQSMMFAAIELGDGSDIPRPYYYGSNYSIVAGRSGGSSSGAILTISQAPIKAGILLGMLILPALLGSIL